VLVGVTRRWALGAVLALVAGVVGALSPQPAAAAKPKPKPTIITIAGEGLAEPLTVRLDEQPQMFAAVHAEVSFLSGVTQMAAPKAKGLGPKYTLVVHYDDKPRFAYDLYPLASGGPKAFRPAKQPGAKVGAGWFLGHLGMSETLRAAGVPLPERPDVMSGGIGGGERAVPDDTLNYDRDLDQLFTELQRVLLLNGAVVVFLTACLAGIALLVRRRTR
jgi:hypothetical protein